jgi:YggT family protein
MILALLAWALQIYFYIILARVILSWFPNIDRSNPIVKFIHDVTEPVLRPVREALPQSGGIDFSPMVVTIGIWVLMQVLFGL